jgi:glycosyltransferase involved in cell wall biosynthesis
MNIVMVGPGFMPIPSTGWGAVENLVWDIRCELVKLGHNVQIVNITDRNQIIDQVNSLNPDFVHVQYDDYADCIPHFKCKKVAVTSHYGYLTQPYRWDGGYRKIFSDCCNSGATIFALSEQIANVYRSTGMPTELIKVVPNGVNFEAFNFSDSSSEFGKTACVAKVEARKRQTLTQQIDRVHYYGRTAPGFEWFSNNKNYCGEWTREKLYSELTFHDNLVLLSDGEAHALVLNEAMAAGLGVVTSELAWSNVDPKLPFVSIIPELLVGDKDYVSHVINQNASLSISNRSLIREYARSWSWENVVKSVYVPAVSEILLRN